MYTWFNLLSEDRAILNVIKLNIITITEQLLWESFYEKSPKQIPTKAIFFNNILPFSKTAINHALATYLKSKNVKIAAKIYILAQISGVLILCKILNSRHFKFYLFQCWLHWYHYYFLSGIQYRCNQLRYIEIFIFSIV